jgi:hypothetical protein
VGNNPVNAIDPSGQDKVFIRAQYEEESLIDFVLERPRRQKDENHLVWMAGDTTYRIGRAMLLPTIGWPQSYRLVLDDAFGGGETSLPVANRAAKWVQHRYGSLSFVSADERVNVVRQAFAAVQQSPPVATKPPSEDAGYGTLEWFKWFYGRYASVLAEDSPERLDFVARLEREAERVYEIVNRAAEDKYAEKPLEVARRLAFVDYWESAKQRDAESARSSRNGSVSDPSWDRYYAQLKWESNLIARGQGWWQRHIGSFGDPSLASPYPITFDKSAEVAGAGAVAAVGGARLKSWADRGALAGIREAIRSPSPKLRQWAQQGGYIDPRTNRWVATNERLAADHVYPKELIEKLPGFEKLKPEQKAWLLNYPGNFEPLPQSWNSSKKNRLADDWARTPMGRLASKEYIDRLRDRQQAFESFAKEMIESFNSQ